MLCALTVRRLKPGTYEEFRKAWEPDQWPEFLTRAWILRHQDDPDQVASLGFFDVSADALDELRDDPEFLSGEARRVERIAAFEEDVLLNGIFEVAEEVVPPGRD